MFTARYALSPYIGCPNRYRTRHFFNNSNTNEDIAAKFEQECVRCVRNEEECVCVYSRCNILISGKIIKEMPVLVASETLCIKQRILFFKRLIYNGDQKCGYCDVKGRGRLNPIGPLSAFRQQ